MVAIIVPLVIVAMIILGTSAALAARSGITGVAVEFLGFKAETLERYAREQWDLLVNNNLTGREDLVAVTKQSVMTQAVETIRSASELTFAVSVDGGSIAFSTRPLQREQFLIEEWDSLVSLAREGYRGWIELSVGGEPRVGYAFLFEPFQWLIVVTETEEAFFAGVTAIVRRTALITGIVFAVVALAIVFLAEVLTRPLGGVAGAMDRIIASGDLASRVDVVYDDEIGRLAHTFNTMMDRLDESYRQIKEYALNAVLAKRDEQKIRNIFQKYVPRDVIDTFFRNPESMLTGETRPVAILFSDVRSFTTISEGSRPDELVSALNRYFTILVDIIMNRHGVVDKYIGDAVMAFFGAPVVHENDCLDAVESAIDIVEALETFNEEQKRTGGPVFLTGLGINYGEVTVGNIGSERKMDYTVIGDTVNLASRLEGLTKYYRQGLIISSSVTDRVSDSVHCRLIDTVVVKGKTVGERIYTARRTLADSEKEAWKLHEQGMQRFLDRDFSGAAKLFRKVKRVLTDDPIAEMFLERCDRYEKDPPPADWNGAAVMNQK
jgi:class 3 adenylate cyclase